MMSPDPHSTFSTLIIDTALLEHPEDQSLRRNLNDETSTEEHHPISLSNGVNTVPSIELRLRYCACRPIMAANIQGISKERAPALMFHGIVKIFLAFSYLAIPGDVFFPANRRVFSLSFGGFCTRCGTMHNLPTTEEARRAASDLRDRMLRSGRIDIDELPSDQQNRLLNNTIPLSSLLKSEHDNEETRTAHSNETDLILNPNLSVSKLYERRGKMFGVLVCDAPDDYSSKLELLNSNSIPSSESGNDNRDDDDKRDVVILKAYAGKLGGEWNLPGWAPLVGKIPETIPEFCLLRDKVTHLFNQIDNATALSKDSEDGDTNIENLIQERAKLSARAMDELRRHQLLTNFRGEKLPITAAFAKGPDRLPGGTGDCAAPKLLAEAVRRGLHPTGICEIFIGATGGMSTNKNDGKFYDACEQRCEQIAGFMLCGLDDNAES